MQVPCRCHADPMHTQCRAHAYPTHTPCTQHARAHLRRAVAHLLEDRLPPLQVEEGALERARGLQAGEALRHPRAVAQHHVEVARLLLAQVGAHAVARLHPARAVGVPPQRQRRPQRPLRAGHRHAYAEEDHGACVRAHAWVRTCTPDAPAHQGAEPNAARCATQRGGTHARRTRLRATRRGRHTCAAPRSPRRRQGRLTNRPSPGAAPGTRMCNAHAQCARGMECACASVCHMHVVWTRGTCMLHASPWRRT